MEKLEIEDFVYCQFPSHIKLSPDRKLAAFLVQQVDIENDNYFSDLFLVNLDDSLTYKLTSNRKISTFDWSFDSKNIFFIEWMGKDSILYKLEGSEIITSFSLPGGASSISEVDDHRVLYIAPVDITASDSKHQHDDCLIADELPFYRDGRKFTNKIRNHLFLFNTETKENRELTTGLIDVEAYDVLGGRVILTGNHYDQVASLRNDLYLIDLVDQKLECLTNRTHMFHGPRFVTNDVVVVLGSDISRYGFRQNKEAIALHLSDKHIEYLTPGWDKSVRQQAIPTDIWFSTSSISSASNGKYYCVTMERDSAYLNVIGLDGVVERVVDIPGAVDSFDAKEDTIVYTAMRGTRLPELFEVQNGAETQLTTLNRDAIAGKAISTPEHFTVPVAGGIELDCWLTRPAGCRPGKRYPVVLEIHGGPKAMSAPIFFHEQQVLANAGYAVVTCNPRGSDGRGDAFHAAILGNFGTIDYDDLMAAVDHAIEHFDLIDPNRMGVTGPSYGGYLTNWIIGHTHRFKAAVSINGISNLLSMIGATEIGYYWPEQYLTVTPWEDHEKYWYHSPLRYADQVNTPTLFIQADQDYVCGLGQGLEMFTALKLFGVDTRMCIFQGENHTFTHNGKPKNRIRYLKEMLAWFDTYLQAPGKKEENNHGY